MTREQWAELSDEEKRIKVAELCGWRRGALRDDGSSWWAKPGCRGQYTWTAASIPDYLNDLNAMHKAVESLRHKSGPEWYDFGHHLSCICGSTLNCINATAAQRAEAFVLTMEAA
jgi:hypothetical protein